MKSARLFNFMSSIRLATKWLCLVLAISAILTNGIAEGKTIRMGYFEGGKYPYHDRLKEEFYRQLEAILPDSIEALWVPEGYRSAEWDMVKCKQMAGELVGVNTIDLVVAQGPWVVNDLLAAGFTRPIIGIHQFAPQYEGLLDIKGQPKAENLTLHYQKNKIESDLTALSKMVRIKKLGFIYFPSSGEADSVLVEAQKVGKQLGFEIVRATGESNKGTFAVFNAYAKLDKHVDALYVGPMWACTIQMINQLMYNVDHNRIPLMVSEDKFFVDRGAFMTNNASGLYAEARFSAYKTAQIILGVRPNTLPVEFSLEPNVAVSEKAANKNKIRMDSTLYNDIYVVPAPPDEDVTVMTLSFAIARAMSFNRGDSAKIEAVKAAIKKAEQFATEDFLAILKQISDTEPQLVNTGASPTVPEKNPQLLLEKFVTRSYLEFVKLNELFQNQLKIRELVDRNIEVSFARQFAEKSGKNDLKFWRTERNKIIDSIKVVRRQIHGAKVVLNTLLNYLENEEIVAEGSRYAIEATQKLYAKMYNYLDDDSVKTLRASTFYQQSVTQKRDARDLFEEFYDDYKNLAINGQQVRLDGISLNDKINQYDAGKLKYEELKKEIDKFYQSQLTEIMGRYGFYLTMLAMCQQMNWSAYDHAYSFVVRIDKLITEGK